MSFRQQICVRVRNTKRDRPFHATQLLACLWSVATASPLNPASFQLFHKGPLQNVFATNLQVAVAPPPRALPVSVPLGRTLSNPGSTEDLPLQDHFAGPQAPAYHSSWPHRDVNNIPVHHTQYVARTMSVSGPAQCAVQCQWTKIPKVSDFIVDRFTSKVSLLGSPHRCFDCQTVRFLEFTHNQSQCCTKMRAFQR